MSPAQGGGMEMSMKKKMVFAAFLFGIYGLAVGCILVGIYYFVVTNRIIWFIISCVGMIVAYVDSKSNVLEDKVFPMIRGRLMANRFSGTHRKLTIGKGVKFMRGHTNISIGDNVVILHHALFAPLLQFHGRRYPSRIIIGDNVHIGAFDRIASLDEVRIGNNVLLSAFVHITDHSHDYREAGHPVMAQGVTSKGPITIGEGAWLAYGAQVIGGGITIGEFSVVAAGAVVTKNVPPYCVVAGCPARIILRYDQKKECWEREN